MQSIKYWGLCLGLLIVTQGRTESLLDHRAQLRREELQRSLDSFTAWTERFAQPSQPATDSLEMGAGVELAKKRRLLLRGLIELNPAQALAAAIPKEVRKRLPESINEQLETPVSGVGDYYVVCEMPQKGVSQPAELHRFVLLDGRTYEAHVHGRRLHQTSKFQIPLHGIVIDGAIALDEKVLEKLSPEEVEASGAAVASKAHAGSGSELGPPTFAWLGKTLYRFTSATEFERSEAMLEDAESIYPAQLPEPASALLEKEIPGELKKRPRPLIAAPSFKRVLVIRADFSDAPGDPRWAGSYASLTADAVQKVADDQVSPYYQKSSYGRANLVFTATSQLYRLPQTAAIYATMLSASAIYQDALAAANMDYSTSDYDIVVVLFTFLGNIPGSRILFGGQTVLGTGQVLVNGEFDFRVLAHEIGHTYNLYHANTWDTNDGDPISDGGWSVEYADLFDTMGANYGNDLRTDFNPWFKYQIDWITDDQVQTVTTNGVYRVYRFDDATARGTLALRIARDADRAYWVGCRRNFTENQTMQHGAYVTWGYSQPRTSNLLCLGATPNDTRGAALALGESLGDNEANLTITALAEGGTAPALFVDVQVTFGVPVVASTVKSPQLQMRSVAGQTLLSWPSWAGAFELESSTGLTGGTWTSVAQQPVLLGSSYVITNVLGTPAKFFRLRRH